MGEGRYVVLQVGLLRFTQGEVMVKFIGLFFFGFVACAQQPGTPPKQAKEPIYRIRLSCPRGQRLWVKESTGWTVPKDRPKSCDAGIVFGDVACSMVEQQTHWFLSAEPVYQNEYGGAYMRCFKGDPN